MNRLYKYTLLDENLTKEKIDNIVVADNGDIIKKDDARKYKITKTKLNKIMLYDAVAGPDSKIYYMLGSLPMSIVAQYFSLKELWTGEENQLKRKMFEKIIDYIHEELININRSNMSKKDKDKLKGEFKLMLYQIKWLKKYKGICRLIN